MGKIYILDTNLVYELLSLKGTKLKGVGALDRPDIDYEKLNSFLSNNLKNKNLFISPVSIFEISNKFKNNCLKLKKVIRGLEKIRNEYKYDLFCKNMGHLFNIDEKIMQSIRQNYKNIKKYKKYLLEEKIRSETEFLYILPLQIVITYFLLAHYEDEQYYKTYNYAVNAFIEKNYELIVDTLKEKIRNKLINDYSIGKEKKSFRNLFEEIIIDCSSYLLIPFDYIYDEISKNKEPTYNLSSMVNKVDNKTVIQKYKEWYQSENKNLANIADILNTIKNVLVSKNYSSCQCEYVLQVIKDFFNNETKMDTNDAEDFWILCFVRDNSQLLTFDKQMIRAIEVGNSKNYLLINSFKKGWKPILGF